MSDCEEGSADSSNGDSAQKSSNSDHSPGDASNSSVNEGEGDSPCSSSQPSPRHAPLPQHFIRVSKERDTSCARTDLSYQYEKKIAVPTNVSI